MSRLVNMVKPIGGAFQFATVAPVPARLAGSLSGQVLAALPIAGLAVGALAAAVAYLAALIYPPAVSGLAAVTAAVLLTRGLHIDGLADTADGLGCYGPPERALSVMRDGSAGPFGVAALVIVLGTQALSFGILTGRQGWLSVGLAVATGRVAAVMACRRGVPAAEQQGFGSRVAGSQPAWLVALWGATMAAIGLLAVPQRPWQGPLAVLLGLLAAALLVRHCVRRFGGITGDVLGAAIELTTAFVALGLAAI